MAEKLDLAKRPCTEHGVVERRDSLDGDFRPRGLMNCGSIRKSAQHVAPKAKGGGMGLTQRRRTRLLR